MVFINPATLRHPRALTLVSGSGVRLKFQAGALLTPSRALSQTPCVCQEHAIDLLRIIELSLHLLVRPTAL